VNEPIEPLEPTRSSRSTLWARLQGDRLAMAGLGVIAALALVALLGKTLTEWVVVLDPTTVRLADKFAPPMSAPSSGLPEHERPPLGVYVLGTDDLGRDVLARMLQGAPVSLSIGFVAVGIAVVLGVLVGGLAGLYGDQRIGPFGLDGLLMRLTDVMLCFPSFFLILTVVALLPPSIYNVMAVIGITGWMGTARLVRAECLSLRRREFVLAARAMGLPEWRVLLGHVLPNALAPVLVSANIAVAGAILTESALSFLGFGVQPPLATWGNVLADGKLYIFDAPWLFFTPGAAILIVVLAFNLLGEGVREALNPRLQRRS
jgi:peptide/nickel transport system permease protein